MISRYNIWYYYWVVMDILCYRFSLIARFYEKTIGQAYYEELDKFNLYTAKKVLHIGCGAYPLSALMLMYHTDANVVSIDKNEIAVQLSKRVIIRKQVKEHIVIDASDGISYPLDQFDAIIISGCSIPMFGLIDYMFTHAKKGTRIIIRLNDEQYTGFKEFAESYKDIHVKKEIENIAFPRFKWVSLLVEKE